MRICCIALFCIANIDIAEARTQYYSYKYQQYSVLVDKYKTKGQFHFDYYKQEYVFDKLSVSSSYYYKRNKKKYSYFVEIIDTNCVELLMLLDAFYKLRYHTAAFKSGIHLYHGNNAMYVAANSDEYYRSHILYPRRAIEFGISSYNRKDNMIFIVTVAGSYAFYYRAFVPKFRFELNYDKGAWAINSFLSHVFNIPFESRILVMQKLNHYLLEEANFHYKKRGKQSHHQIGAKLQYRLKNKKRKNKANKSSGLGFGIYKTIGKKGHTFELGFWRVT